MSQTNDPGTIRDAVRTRYAAAATAVARATTSSDCCSGGASCCGNAIEVSEISSVLYSVDEVGELPTVAVLASLGCGNPTALAEFKPGETVLDFDSAAASTCCCRRAASGNRLAYGLDMTDEMLELA